MRILLISQYFWPENFKINDIAQALKERGHQVTVLTGIPNYPEGIFYNKYSYFTNRIEIWNGIKIYRSLMLPRGKASAGLLFLNYITFAIFSSFNVFFIKERFDKIFVYEPSPITVGIPGLVSKLRFNAPIYFWVQDLWPESLRAAAGIENRFILNLFGCLTKLIYSQSHKILVQSKAFIPYIIKQKVQAEKLMYYPNSTESFYNDRSPDLNILSTLPKGFKVMFAGNLGEAQSFDTILNAAKLLVKEDINVQFVILGNGRLKNYIEEKIIELGLGGQVHLLGSFDSNIMPIYFSCADALLVSLKKDPIFSLTIPSKIQSYMACGKPIIASLDGEGARIIEEAKAGFTSGAEDVIGLMQSVKKLLSLSIQDQIELGRNARCYFEQEFEREILVDKLEWIFQK